MSAPDGGFWDYVAERHPDLLAPMRTRMAEQQAAMRAFLAGERPPLSADGLLLDAWGLLDNRDAAGTDDWRAAAARWLENYATLDETRARALAAVRAAVTPAWLTCTCASTPPTMPTFRLTTNHLAFCPLASLPRAVPTEDRT